MSTARPLLPRVAVFSPNQGAPTETFIRAHIEHLPLETIPLFGGQWQLAGSKGYLWPMLRYPGWTLGKAAPRLGARAYALALARKLRKLRIDVALAEYGMTGARVMGACAVANVPLVVHFHGFDASVNAVLEQWMADYRRMFAQSAAIIAVSTPMEAQLVSWGAPREKVHRIVYGVDPSKFSGAAPAEAEPHFVAVGRFVEKKAPNLTVLAFREAANVVPSAKLSMVGDGPLLGSTRRLAMALGLEKNVQFLGVQPAERVAELMRTARAFVQHSLVADDGDSEGTPVAIIEAQMTGLPVVSTRHGGIPEVVRNEETGYLVEEGDTMGMGTMMARLALDPVLAGNLGARAREHASRNFTLERNLAAVAAVLREAANRK